MAPSAIRVICGFAVVVAVPVTRNLVLTMRCKTCDYRLWNLKARQCPECGTPFSVSDYEFIPNSVQFCCPHCGQDYYGTGYKGHLVPEAFLCVKCGQPVHMNDMALLPTEGIEEERTSPQQMPWLDRQHNGWWRSWWSTVRMSLFSPGELVRRLPANSPAASAWWFAVVSYAIITGVGITVLAGAGLIMAGFAGGPAAVPSFAFLAIAFLPLLFIAALAVWAIIAHLVLLLTGGTAHGFRGTCEAVCYSVGTNIVTLIPGCGMYLYWIWWLVSAAIMLKERQRVHALRAMLALMTLPVLMAAGIGLTIWSLSKGPTFMATATVNVPPPTTTGAASTTASTAENQVSTLAANLNQYAENHGGRGPQHLALLVAAGQIGPANLLLPDSATTADKVRIGEAQLNAIQAWPSEAQAVAVRDAIASLPADVVAYRLGDFVFTYPGMDFQRLDRKLWTVIAWPDPDANAAGTPAEVIVGLLDGSTTRLYGPQMGMFLEDQNALRAKNGLAPLPHPQTVRHGQPARVQAEEEP